MKRIATLLALLLALGAVPASAQSQTGTIEGRVVDEQGGVLPGVSVTLTGRQGSQSAVTDAQGVFRFLALNPGRYEVKAELSGFVPASRTAIEVSIGRTINVPLSLRVGGVQETIEVTANATSIDVTSAATENSLSQDLLINMPINIGVFNSATSLLNYAPGINSSSGYGGDASYGNSLLIDGVDTRDPEGGSAWVFFGYNIIEEMQVGGLGAPAEYGGFTGAVVNTITKSGGNKYSGLFEYRHTNDGLASKNVSDENLRLNPALGNANVLTSLNDANVQLGGPFIKDKLFWWFSAQRYGFEADPVGPRTTQTEVSPRYNGKLTWQMTPNDTLVTSFQYDNYNVTGRLGLIGAAEAKDDDTLNQDSPEAIWNVQYRKVFGPTAFLEAKFTGYWGYYYLDPVDPASFRFDLDTGASSGGAGYLYYADRGRNQLNVAFSKFVDAAGKHSFKFGMEIERSKSESRFEYMNGVYFLDYSGVPAYAYGYSYQINGKNRRESFYAQDNWEIGNRLTANLGLRLDNIRGVSPNDGDETIYTPNLAIGPRLGLAWDVTGDGKTVARGFWGRYYEGASFNPWQRATSGYSDFLGYEVINGRLVEILRVPAYTYGIEDDIDHLGLDEWNVSLERQLTKDMRVAVTYVQRDYKNFINSVVPNGRWTPISVNNPLTNSPLTLYRWANRSTTEEEQLIRNIDGFQYLDPTGRVLGVADANRDYKSLMIVLTKSYSDRWQGQFSYVWSKAEGTVGNGGTASVTGSFFEYPSFALVNAFGPMNADRTHEIKLMGGVKIPKVEVSLNAYYRGLSGLPYQADISVTGSTLNRAGSSTIWIEPRGSRRLPFFHQIDLRAEKVFEFDVHRLGFFVDVQNLLNEDTMTGVQTRYPSRSISGNSVAFGSPTAIQGARQVTLGARWSF
jgi:hypothetical protein